MENIAFHDAAVPDRNGAGIRLDGVGLTVRHCRFRNNENGILTSNPGEGNVLIEYSEFDGGGFGDGQSHNLYVGRVRSLVFRFNYSHHANVGHCLKSRAQSNRIEYNRIMDEEEGNSSRLIDLPNGGLSTIRGNLFMQCPNAPNNNMVGYGHEGYTEGITHELYVGNNTFVNERLGSCLFVDIRPGADVAWLVNNFIVGTGTLLQGEVAGQGGNLRSEPAAASFVDGAAYGYRLLADSPAIDAGVTTLGGNGVVIVPNEVYLDFLTGGTRTRFGNVDAGAYEYEWPSSTTASGENRLVLFPNPTSGNIDLLNGRDQVEHVQVIDVKGRIVRTLPPWLLTTALYPVTVVSDLIFLVFSVGKEYEGISFSC